MKPANRLAGALLVFAGFPTIVLLCTIFVFSARAQKDASANSLEARARAALSTTRGQIRLAGLLAPVKVLRDHWGVPHIYAQNTHDLFFAQGFVAAQDRLFQMELWKRAGQGRLAEVTGKSALPRDIAARLLRYRGSMQAEYASYAPDTREILEAFTEGINAYIRRRMAPGGPGLPIEFQLAGFAPEMWKPEDCLTRMATLSVTGNAPEELANAQLVALIGAQKATDLENFDPPTKLETFPGEDFQGLAPGLISGFVGTDSRIQFPDKVEGSNNWTVAGELTKTGKPLVANDPHRTLALPSLRYVVHLVAPGWDVIGATEPALPGVSIGHNQDIAWGLTVFPVDQEDLFYEALNPKDPLEYRTASGWARMRVEKKVFHVKGGPDVTVDLKFTQHGPVLWSDGKRALALHWVGAEPGTAPYLTGISLDRAHNWTQFLAGMARWKTPPENFVYGDRQGNIGEQSAGLTPLRRKGNGLLPAPGWAGYEWAGYIPLDKLPRQFNPARGFIATANNKTIPADYPYAVGFDWSTDRIARIEQVLSAAQRHALGVEDMAALQNDVVSLPAQALVRVLASSGAADDPHAKLLIGWNGALHRDSAAAALYEIWIGKLHDAMLKIIAPNQPNLPIYLSAETFARLFGHPAVEFFGANPVLARDEIFRQTIDAAYADAQKRMGGDPQSWGWGKLHFMRFRHVLDPLDNLAGFLDPPPVPRPGDDNTVDATWNLPNNYDQLGGASYREIFDVSDWDRSEGVNVPGESGQPGSSHYSDLVPLWRDGKYFPLAYSEQAVEAQTTDRLELLPAKP
jgi:penicillin G amidase